MLNLSLISYELFLWSKKVVYLSGMNQKILADFCLILLIFKRKLLQRTNFEGHIFVFAYKFLFDFVDFYFFYFTCDLMMIALLAVAPKGSRAADPWGSKGRQGSAAPLGNAHPGNLYGRNLPPPVLAPLCFTGPGHQRSRGGMRPG
jgi:hypothetical protein